jgi:uncharacterized protein (DUF58 family)
MLAFDLIIAGLVVADIALTRGPVELTRRVAAVQAVGRPVPVTLVVRNAGARALELRVTDDAPGVTEGLPARLRLMGGASHDVDYTTTVDERGAHGFGPATVRWRSVLGLFEGQSAVQGDDTLRVYPNFRQLRTRGISAVDAERRLPVRVRRRPGGESEFERLRPYVWGDSYRHIDWKATARRRQFISREFGQESNQNVIFLLDCGRLMSGRVGGMALFDHALNASMMMAQTALRHGDRVGLLAFDSEVRAWLAPRGGARSGAGLIRATYDLRPSLEEPDYALAFRYLAQRVRRRSLVVLVTTVIDEVNADLTAQIVGALGRRHIPLCVWLRDDAVEARLRGPRATERDHFVGGAAADLLAWRAHALAGLRRGGALVVDTAPGDLSASLLSRYLEIKAGGLL